MSDRRIVESLIETVKNQVAERETGCLTMLGERVLVAEIEQLRSEAAELRQVVAMAKLPTEPTLANRAFPNPLKVII